MAPEPLPADRPIVPADFPVPMPPPGPAFVFEILGPEHNESDLAAWSASIDHIHATPGFRPEGWPRRIYTLEENLADLEQHRDHHLRALDFAWTVLDPVDGSVIGCVYLKPAADGPPAAEARSWVRADRADLDRPLREHLAPWFETAWPMPVAYAVEGVRS